MRIRGADCVGDWVALALRRCVDAVVVKLELRL